MSTKKINLHCNILGCLNTRNERYNFCKKHMKELFGIEDYD